MFYINTALRNVTVCFFVQDHTGSLGDEQILYSVQIKFEIFKVYKLYS